MDLTTDLDLFHLDILWQVPSRKEDLKDQVNVYELVSMDLLPLDILWQVAAYVAADLTPKPKYSFDKPLKPSLKSYATISRNWQIVCEPHTFSKIKLKSPDLNQFLEIFSNPRRYGLLKELEYHVVLPTYSKDRCCRFETKKEKKDNNTVFGEAIHGLFEVLAAWQKQGKTQESEASRVSELSLTSLRVDVYSPMDDDKSSLYLFWHKINLRAASQLIEFQGNETRPLPVIQSITELELRKNWKFRSLHLNTVRHILTALPQLTSLTLNCYEPLLKQESLRREYWYFLGQLLTYLAVSFRSLRYLYLGVEFINPNDHSFDLGDLRQPDDLNDMTMIALHRMVMAARSSLTEFTLGEMCCVSPQFFWPSGNTTQSLSSNLKVITIEANARTSQGTWYYTEGPEMPPHVVMDSDIEEGPDVEEVDPDSLFIGNVFDDDPNNNNDDGNNNFHGSESEEGIGPEIPDLIDGHREAFLNGMIPKFFWRHQIDPVTFHPLLIAMVRAVLHLPKLNQLFFRIGFQLPDMRMVQIECSEGGEAGDDVTTSSEDDKNSIEERRWDVYVGEHLVWKLPSTIKDLMRQWSGEEGTIHENVITF